MRSKQWISIAGCGLVASMLCAPTHVCRADAAKIEPEPVTIEAAKALMAERQLDKAATMLNEMTTGKPDLRKDAYTLLYQCYLSQKKYDKTMDCLKLLSAYPEARMEVIQGTDDCLCEQGKFAEAVELLNKQVLEYPQAKDDSYLRIGDHLWYLGKYDDAIAWIRKELAECHTPKQWLQWRLVRCYKAKGQPEDVAGYLRKAVTDYPELQTSADLWMANFLHTQDKHDDEIKLYDKAVDECPEVKPDVYPHIVDCLLGRSKPSDAAPYVGKLLDESPAIGRDKLARLADCFIATKKYDDAIAQLQRFHDEYPQAKADAYLRISDCLKAQDKQAEAVGYLNKVLEESPEAKVDALVRLTDCLMALKKQNDAIALLGREIVNLPEKGEAVKVLRYKMADAYRQMSLPDAAVQVFAEISRAFPEESARTQMMTSEVYASKGDLVKAVSALEDGLTMTSKGNSGRKEIFLRLIGFRASNKDLTKAEATFKMAIEEYPLDTPRLQVELASTYLQLGNSTQGLALLKTAVETCPKDYPERAGVLFRAAELYRDKYRLDQSLEVYRTIKADYPDKAVHAGIAAGGVLIRQGKYTEARTLLRSALAANPKDQPVPPELKAMMDKCDLLISLDK